MANFENTFTRYIDIQQSTEEEKAELRKMVNHLLDVGGSFAILDGKMWFSDFSLMSAQEWLIFEN